MQNLTHYPALVFALSVIVLWLSAWFGKVFVAKVHPLDMELREDFGVIRGATLTLLALLIGFGFSMAIERYDMRKRYEEAEANAIGMEYVRAELLPAADVAPLRALLRTTLISALRSIWPTKSPSFSKSMSAPRSCRPDCGPPSFHPPPRNRRRSSPWLYRA